MTHQLTKPRVFLDADVIFAGSASPTQHSASQVILRLAEITLIEAITSEQAIIEAERNLAQKIPQALTRFRIIVARSLTVALAPEPDDLLPYAGLADKKDLPLLVAALQAKCPWFVTFNARHYRPGHPTIKVYRPGEFIIRVRELLTYL